MVDRPMSHRFHTYEEVRQAMGSTLPWAIKELLIAGIVTERYSVTMALKLSWAIDERLSKHSCPLMLRDDIEDG